MFFVSEEFLRKYQEEEEIVQTIDQAVPLGGELFDNVAGKKEHNKKERERSGQGKDEETPHNQSENNQD